MFFPFFVHQFCFVIISPSLWFYLDYLEKTNYYGVVWASYFVGQACFVPGWRWSKRINFTISCILGIMAGFIYCYPNIYTIIFSRFIQGMASSSISTLITEGCQVPNKQRNQVLTKLFFWQSLGYLLGPGVGWLLSYIPTTLIFWPGYCGLFISFSYLCLQITLLFTQTDIENITEEGLLAVRVINKYHSNFRLLIFNLNHFFFSFLLAIYDSLITPIALYVYHYDFHTIVLCWIIIGVVIVSSFLILTQIINKMSSLVLYQIYLTFQFGGIVLLLLMKIDLFFLAIAIISFSLSGCLVLNFSIYSREVRPNEKIFIILYLIVGSLGRAIGSIFFQLLYRDLYQIFVSLSIFSLLSLLLLSLSNIIYFSCN